MSGKNEKTLSARERISMEAMMIVAKCVMKIANHANFRLEMDKHLDEIVRLIRKTK